MNEPVSISKDGSIKKDDKGLFSICPGCENRIKMSTDFPDDPSDTSGTCDKCGCCVDADKKGIWGMSFPGGDDE